MTRLPFCVRNDDLVGSVTEDTAQSVDLGRGTASARGRVGLVRNEDGMGRNLLAGNAMKRFGLGHQVFHHLADVLHIEARAVEGAVRGNCAEYFADGLNSPFPRGFGTFDDQAGGAHADDQAVAAAVKGSGGFFYYFVGGRGPAGKETGAEPFDGVVGGDVVGRDDDHAAAAAGTDPVFGQRHRLRGAGAGGIDLRVGATGADELGELGVAHGKSAEEEAAIEDVGLFLDGIAEVFGTAFDFLFEDGIAIAFRASSKQAFQQAELLAAGVVGVVARHFIGEGITSGKGRGKDHAGVFAQRVRQGPPVLQLRALCGGLVAHDQRDTGVAQGIETHGNRQLGDSVEGGAAIGGNAEFNFQIECAAAARQLDDVSNVVDGFEGRSAVVAFDQAGDVLVEHGLAQTRGDEVDKLITAQDAGEIRVIEDVVGSGQAQGGAGDDYWILRGG